jgi:hypothetical protein
VVPFCGLDVGLWLGVDRPARRRASGRAPAPRLGLVGHVPVAVWVIEVEHSLL